jgi:tRNA A-37 threonylcarbamoyl transferase component Bud32
LRKNQRADLLPIDIQLENLSDQLKSVETDINTMKDQIKLAEQEKKLVENIKDKYETKSINLRLIIDQTQALRVRKNRYWLDLINERFRQHQMNRHQ